MSGGDLSEYSISLISPPLLKDIDRDQMASGATHLNQLFSKQTCPLAENLDLIFFTNL